MPTFQNYLDSIKDPKQHQQIRFQLIGDIEAHTKRKLIVYAADFRKAPLCIIDQTDKVGFSDLIEGIQGNPLDVLIHSPGGFAEATEDLVKLIRANFSHVRFIIPHSAFSAATMFCLSGNEILMDERSSLGPIDPQIQIPSSQGQISVPAQIIIDGFKQAQDSIYKDPKNLPVYLPWLNQYTLFVQICRDADDLSKTLVKDWLVKFMFSGTANCDNLADQIVSYFSDRSIHKSHSRKIGIEESIGKGLKIFDMRKDTKLRDLVWRLYCCIELYFDRSPSYKLFENKYGVSFARNIASIQVQLPQQLRPIIPPTQPPSPSPTP